VLPAYERRDGRTFRGWLFAVCCNECRDFSTRRATRPLPGADGLSGVAASQPEADMSEEEYRRSLVRQVLDSIQTNFSAVTWAAFKQFVVDGRPAADVARELGTTANAVYLAQPGPHPGPRGTRRVARLSAQFPPPSGKDSAAATLYP
jgi:RNA polymerase sigma-70 factor (ECF subfamily)